MSTNEDDGTSDEWKVLIKRLEKQRNESLQRWSEELRIAQDSAAWHEVPADEELASMDPERSSPFVDGQWRRGNKLLVYALVHLDDSVDDFFSARHGTHTIDRNRRLQGAIVGHLRKYGSHMEWDVNGRPHLEWDLASATSGEVHDLKEAWDTAIPEGRAMSNPNHPALVNVMLRRRIIVTGEHGPEARTVAARGSDYNFDTNLMIYGFQDWESKFVDDDYSWIHASRVRLVPTNLGTKSVRARLGESHPYPGLEMEMECPRSRFDEFKYVYVTQSTIDHPPQHYNTREPRRHPFTAAPISKRRDEDCQYLITDYYKFKRVRRFRVVPGFAQDAEDPVYRNNRTYVPAFEDNGQSEDAPAWVVLKTTIVLRKPESTQNQVTTWSERFSVYILNKNFESCSAGITADLHVMTPSETCHSRWKALAGVVKMQRPLRAWNLGSNERHYAPNGLGANLAFINFLASQRLETQQRVQREWDALDDEQRNFAEMQQLLAVWKQREEEKEEEEEDGRALGRHRSLRDSDRSGRSEVFIGDDALPNLSGLKL